MTILRFMLSWVLYAMGHVVSRPTYFPYRLYSWLMMKSAVVQGENVSKYWPWQKLEYVDGEEA